MPQQELELEVLECISTSSKDLRQRDLANIIGKSLGMTNAILHRLTEKGLLKVSRINNRNISYAVTPHGMKELARRSYDYFKRTIKNVVFYKDEIESLVVEHLRVHGKNSSVILVGASDMDFIIEHLTMKYQLDFFRQDRIDSTENPDSLFILGEEFDRESPPHSIRLADLIRDRTTLST